VNVGQACIIAGTWSINEVITAEALVDPGLFMTSLFASPGLFLSTEASATSATNLEWFLAQCCGDERLEAQQRGISVYDVCNEKVASVDPQATNIFFHPFLFGSNIQPTARAGFYGIAGWHTRAHLLRALYEGVVFGHLSHINKLRAAGAQIKSARLTGGGSRSQVWSQIFADTIQVPMEITDGSELGARGAALSAGVGTGVYSDYSDAVDQAVKLKHVYEPNSANAALYLARFEEYSRLIQAMQSSWDSINLLSR
jgi:L-xylulokinase